MERKREIVAVCHCILNCNSKVEGLSNDKGSHNVSLQILSSGYGIIQLPCPEMVMYGIKRWGHVKEQFDNLFYRNQCKIMLDPYIKQFENYITSNYKIKAIIAIDGSPSCGYNKTCSSNNWFGELSGCNNLSEKLSYIKMIDGKGIFIEELEKSLKENNLEIPIIGLDESVGLDINTI